MRAALDEAGRMKKGKKFAVVGEMRELGEGAEDYHRELTPLFSPFNSVWLVGKTWERAVPEEMRPQNVRRWTGSLEELSAEVVAELGDGDLIFVKGSRGNSLDVVTERLSGVKAQ